MSYSAEIAEELDQMDWLELFANGNPEEALG